MKDLKVYLPNVRFFVMVIVVLLLVTFIVRKTQGNPTMAKVGAMLGYSTGA